MMMMMMMMMMIIIIIHNPNITKRGNEKHTRMLIDAAISGDINAMN